MVTKGDYLYDSWGYDQTNVDFCRVISISPTGKTVTCRMVRKRHIEEDEVVPTTNMVGPTFRLKIKGEYLRGSYPYIPERPDYKRFGLFNVWNGTPVYQTPAGCGH